MPREPLPVPRKVIRGFARQWQAPDSAEGFGQLWRLASEAEQEPSAKPKHRLTSEMAMATSYNW